MALLQYAENKKHLGAADRLPAIGWFPDGRFMVVRDKETLVQEILPKFGLSVVKFSSFVR
jgi:hypothetical protein